jgi:peptide/nickel transport system substrate-binding protein
MTDIVGSTEHAAELGDAAWRDLVQQHHALIRAALRRRGGREIDTAGDGFFAIFDAPATAVACALEASEAVSRLGIEIRAGVHVGEVEQVGGKVAGISVPIASRIMAGAVPGEVLVSSTVRDLAAGSGLIFTDRGSRELKGVPGEWHVYAVGRAQSASTDTSATSATATAQQRRAAAVQRASARPIWQRRPRLVAVAVICLAVVIATAGLLVWKPWQPPALAAVKENSVGIIDPDRNEVVGQISVGARPGGIAVSDGYAWVTNTGADTVSQVDLATRTVSLRIDVGHEPKGIAVAEGSVWVVNSGDRTVSRINIAASRVVDAIDVGNGPTAIVASGSTLWVANALDSTVQSIDARTAAVGQPIAVAATPIALAIDGAGLWVASEDGASVTQLDPVTGATRAAAIQLAARPSAIALDPQSAWVASADGTVTRIERDSNRVTATVVVGGSLNAILVQDAAVWVGDQDGNVTRLAAAEPNSALTHISTSSAVASLAVVDRSLWLAAQPSASSHRGGTLHIVEAQRIEGLASGWDADPLADPVRTLAYLEGDGLVAYRRAGGTAGSTLLPDLAMSIPRPTNGGLAYTFQLRPDLMYSTGAPVRASDFRRAIERSFQVAGPFGGYGPFLFTSISGTTACVNVDQTAVERCDLSADIVADDTAGTITFNLEHVDQDFVFKLAHAAAYPVPEGVPMNEVLKASFPGTGPYTLSATTEAEARMIRNPHFRVWDVHPDGFPDEIVFSVVGDDAERVAMVENGGADFTSYGGESRTSPDLFAQVKRQYAGQWHVGTSTTTFISMNSSIPPFDNADARRAVNFALDRGHVADIAGGPPDVAITCQLLPPGFPGYQPYCPYTFNPDAGGRWKQPDMQAAQQLIDASGTRGQQVTVGPAFSFFNGELDYLATVLEGLGYQVTIDREADFEKIVEAFATDQITINGWFPDYVAPSNFLGLFTCGGDPVISYCDPDFDSAFNHALELQATDPAAALAEWAAVDRRGVDLALLAPLYNSGGAFVSDRVGNYQYNSFYGVLFDQMWVQ